MGLLKDAAEHVLGKDDSGLEIRVLRAGWEKRERKKCVRAREGRDKAAHLGWEHEAVSLPGATGLWGGQIWAVTALDGAGHAAKWAGWQGSGDAAWEPSAKPRWLQRAGGRQPSPGTHSGSRGRQEEGLARTVPRNSTQPAPRSRPRLLPGLPSQGTGFGTGQGTGHAGGGKMLI